MGLDSREEAHHTEISTVGEQMSKVGDRTLGDLVVYVNGTYRVLEQHDFEQTYYSVEPDIPDDEVIAQFNDGFLLINGAVKQTFTTVGEAITVADTLAKPSSGKEN